MRWLQLVQIFFAMRKSPEAQKARFGRSPISQSERKIASRNDPLTPFHSLCQEDDVQSTATRIQRKLFVVFGKLFVA